MRKISVFFLTISIIAGFFLSIGSTFAQFNYAGGNTANNSPKIQYCKEEKDCSIKSGLDTAQTKLDKDITNKAISQYAQDVVAYFLGFISLIGVIYIVWAGFRIMTGAGDEDTVNNSKKTVIYVVLGLILMWLAYSIIYFVMKLLNNTRIAYHPPEKTYFAFQFIPTVSAQSYTESEAGTFGEYKHRVQVAAEELEAELKINKKVSSASISKLKNLVQQAFDRLPDKSPEESRANESAKRYVDMRLELALKEPDSQQIVGEAISQVVSFVQSAKIGTIQGNISATPLSGNAPLVTSFLAQNVIDPSGTIPPNNNYIWWIRENGGRRKELGRGPSLTHEFREEGTYTINLDVVSASRNSKGRTDILPLSTSVNVQVLPKLGEITLLVNGVNVSNMHEMKISPAIASQGLIFDATASRAIGNGRILETKWNFGNGVTKEYKSSPGAERQVFATTGEFPVKLEFKTNDGQVFSKEITLRIKDPAASIKAEKLTGHAGDSLSFSAETYFGNVRNVEYIWTVQSDNGKRPDTQSGNPNGTFNYTFKEIGNYTVTLKATSPSGETDSDSKTIVIESHNPIATLDTPKIISSEQPNTFIFDASRSYDPDTNSRQGLSYTWRLNGEPIQLEPLPTATDQQNNKGTYTFDTIGENTIEVTVTNKHGKIATAEQKFTVQSVLAGQLLVTPQVVKVGEIANFIAIAPNAQFFIWSMGDGSPQRSGNHRVTQHIFQKTGIYSVTVTLQGTNPNDTTTITRRVYVTDMDNPLAIIDITNSSNSAILEKGVCDGKDAYILKRGEMSTINGENSVNIDGSPSQLDYTWRFMGKVSTLSTLSENFKDLGCFPISLTVKSKTNGASHTATEYIKLINQPPQLTNISTTIDTNKKDSQKIIVKATANGVTDKDGVITSYIWYYTTGSDDEPQGLQITQKPEMTFVLPNVTEKYNFGVIIEDNDGARIDSRQYLNNQTPVIIDNENSNINMPLITLNVPSKMVKVGQNVTFSAEAKTILGTNVTTKSQYAWDFDGDGRIDEKSNTPSINHTFTRAGDYNMRVRVTHNGVSNIKYHTIHVRNELKAGVIGYKLPDGRLYLLNTSKGVYDKAKWILGDFSSTQLESVILEENEIPNTDASGKIGSIKVTYNDADFSDADILASSISTVHPSENGEIIYQSFPKAENDVIIISDPSEVLKISFYGNKATNYAVDTDLQLDGNGENMDGIPDNDIDNREHASYTNGSLFTISDFGQSQSRERKIKITLYDGVTPIKQQIITVILDFIPENNTDDNILKSIDEGALTIFERERLETLSEMIRNLENDDRIILMKKYNILAENWMNNFEKAKNLIDLQDIVNNRETIKNKDAFSQIIDELLTGDAQLTNSITVAIKLIKDLLPPDSQNYQQMIEKIDAIANNPSDRMNNQKLAMELYNLVKSDPLIDDKYKVIIHQQLEIIGSNGENTNNVSVDASPKKEDSSSGFMGFLRSIGKILGIILAVIFFIFIGFFILYKIKSTDENMGFQDFIIDLFANKSKVDSASTLSPVEEKKPDTKDTKIVENANSTTDTDIDPLKSYIPPESSTNDPIATSKIDNTAENPSGGVPDWLKEATITEGNNIATQEFLSSTNPSSNEKSTKEGNIDTNAFSSAMENSTDISTGTTEKDPIGGLPDWLQGNAETSETVQNNAFNENNTIDTKDISINTNTSTGSEAGLPDWLQGGMNSSNESSASNITSSEILNGSEVNQSGEIDNILTNNDQSEVPHQETPLPHWLQEEDKTDNASIGNTNNKNDTAELDLNIGNHSQNVEPGKIQVDQTHKELNNTLPDWLQSQNNTPDSIDTTPSNQIVNNGAPEVSNETQFISQEQKNNTESDNVEMTKAEDITTPRWLKDDSIQKISGEQDVSNMKQSAIDTLGVTYSSNSFNPSAQEEGNSSPQENISNSTNTVEDINTYQNSIDSNFSYTSDKLKSSQEVRANNREQELITSGNNNIHSSASTENFLNGLNPTTEQTNLSQKEEQTTGKNQLNNTLDSTSTAHTIENNTTSLDAIPSWLQESLSSTRESDSIEQDSIQSGNKDTTQQSVISKGEGMMVQQEPHNTQVLGTDTNHEEVPNWLVDSMQTINSNDHIQNGDGLVDSASMLDNIIPSSDPITQDVIQSSNATQGGEQHIAEEFEKQITQKLQEKEEKDRQKQNARNTDDTIPDWLK